MAKKKKGKNKLKNQPVTKKVKKDPIDLWLEYLIYSLVILLPLTFSRITFDQFDIIKMGVFRFLTFVMLIIWIVKLFVAKKVKINWTVLDFLLVAFLLIVLISSVFSTHVFTAFQGKYKRFEGFFTFVNYFVVYFVALQVFNDKRKIAKLARVIGVTAIVVAAYGLLQYLNLDLQDWGAKPFDERSSFSSFGNPDLLAGYLALALPVLLGNMIGARNRLETIMFGIGFFIVSGTLLTTSTRGAWLGAIVGVIAFVVISAPKLRNQVEKIAIVILAFMVFFAAILIYSSNPESGVMSVYSRIKSITDLSGGSVGSRIEIWKAGMAMVKDRPLLGQGLDTFRMASEKFETFKYVKIVGGKTVADNAHNYVVHILSGAGIPAGIVFLSFIFTVFYFSFRQSRRQPTVEIDDDLTDGFTTYAIVIGTVGFIIYLGFVVRLLNSKVVTEDFANNLLFSFLLWFVFAALLIIQQPIEKSSIVSKTDYSYPALVGAAIGYFTYLISGISVVGSSSVFWVILAAIIGNTVLKRQWIMERHGAAAVNAVLAVVMIVPMSIATYTTMTMLIADYIFADAYFLTNTRSVTAVDAYKRAFSLYPNGRYAVDLGRYYINQGSTSENVDLAIAVFKQAKEAEPLEADYRIFLANTYEMKYSLTKDERYLEMAIDEITEVVKRRPYSVPANYLLGSYYYQKQKYEKAAERLHVVEDISPDYADLFTRLSQVYTGLGNAELASYYAREASNPTK